jgi:hypothetical protein
MRRIDWFHCTTSKQFVLYTNEIESISQPLNDESILHMQDLLLSHGFQYLRLKSISEGRMLMQTFLENLSYHSVGCLTLESNPGVTDIYQILDAGDYLSDKYALQEYFLDHFQFDFVWIEATQELLSSENFEQIKQAMITCVLDHHMPILICVYDI